jgi:hypothetical protein
MRIYGKGEKVREIPIHPQLRTALTAWLDERPGWPGADKPCAVPESARQPALGQGSPRHHHRHRRDRRPRRRYDHPRPAPYIRHTARTWRNRPRRRRRAPRPRAPRDNTRLHPANPRRRRQGARTVGHRSLSDITRRGATAGLSTATLRLRPSSGVPRQLGLEDWHRTQSPRVPTAIIRSPNACFSRRHDRQARAGAARRGARLG